jgi:hypothetical protein
MRIWRRRRRREKGAVEMQRGVRATAAGASSRGGRAGG